MSQNICHSVILTSDSCEHAGDREGVKKREDLGAAADLQRLAHVQSSAELLSPYGKHDGAAAPPVGDDYTGSLCGATQPYYDQRHLELRFTLALLRSTLRRALFTWRCSTAHVGRDCWDALPALDALLR
ncbi:unnamed protein product [Arctogadus glacialis]